MSEGQTENTVRKEVPMLDEAILKLKDAGELEGDIGYMFILSNKKIQ